MKTRLSLLILMFYGMGCTYEGTFIQSAPQTHQVAPAYPLAVALVETREALCLTYTGMPHQYKMQIQPEATAGLCKALEKVFSRVILLPENAPVPKEIDLLLVPQISGGGSLEYGALSKAKIELTLLGKDPQTGEEVFRTNYLHWLDLPRSPWPLLNIAIVTIPLVVFLEGAHWQKELVLQVQRAWQATVEKTMAELIHSLALREYAHHVAPLANRYALLVGISQYPRETGIAPLPFADGDALAMANILKQGGWDARRIALLTNQHATGHNVKQTLESWLGEIGNQDLLLVYWSGQMILPEAANSEALLAFYDTRATDAATAYPLTDLLAMLRNYKARNTIILTDLGYTGKPTRPEAEGAARLVGRDLPRGWLYLGLADAHRQAMEYAAWAHGAFTYILLEALAGKADVAGPEIGGDGLVTVAELRDYVNAALPKETQRVLGVAKSPVLLAKDQRIWHLALTNRKQKSDAHIGK